jgi:hypothetical protein
VLVLRRQFTENVKLLGDHVAVSILISLQQIDLVSFRDCVLHSPVIEGGMKFMTKKV